MLSASSSSSSSSPQLKRTVNFCDFLLLPHLPLCFPACRRMDSMEKKYLSCVAQRTRRRDDLYVENLHFLLKESGQFKRAGGGAGPKKTAEVAVGEDVGGSGSKRRRLCDGNSEERKRRNSPKSSKSGGEKAENLETLVFKNSSRVEEKNAIDDSVELIGVEDESYDGEEGGFSPNDLRSGGFEEEDGSGSLSGSERRRLCDGNSEERQRSSSPENSEASGGEKAENLETLVFKNSSQVEEENAIGDSVELIVVENESYDDEELEEAEQTAEESEVKDFEDSGEITVVEDVAEKQVVTSSYDLRSRRFGGGDSGEIERKASDLKDGNLGRGEVPQAAIEALEEIVVIDDLGEEKVGSLCSDSTKKRYGCRNLETGTTENVGGFKGPNVEINLSKDKQALPIKKKSSVQTAPRSRIRINEEKFGSLCSDSTKKRFGCRNLETGTTENVGGFEGPSVETNLSKGKQPLPLKKKSSEQTACRLRINEAAPVEDPESGTGLDDLWAGMESVFKSTDLGSSSDSPEMEQPFPVAKELSEQLGHKLPMRFRYDVAESESVQTSKSGTEFDDLWDDMNFAMKSSQIGLAVSCEPCTTPAGGESGGETEESSIICPAVNHDLILDEEIGMVCRICGHVLLEIKYVASPMLEKQGQYTESDRLWFEEEDSLLDGLLCSEPGSKAEDSCSLIEGSVWELIPDVRDTLFPHQRQAFEFIWRNLAGSIDMAKLKSSNGDESCGGCIISHAPGTGKTRLAMVFLQAYFELFPDCRPVIVAPASILLTWAHEFQKWKFKVPFYNLNNSELAEEESKAAKEKLDIGGRKPSKTMVRLMKLFLWMQNRSILGISYSLYGKLAGEASTRKKKVGRKNKKLERIKEILVEEPRLLVLDEGHTPRNHRSGIWKALLNIKTEKRILLSGTPFQNNFLELCNTLCMARPSFPKTVPSSFKKLWQNRPGQLKGDCRSRKLVRASFFRSVEKLNDQEIEKLKSLMAPFVHVYKGYILKKDLPGLIDCVIVFNPSELQKELLKIIDTSQTNFEFEHKEALCSLHPFLFKSSSLSKKEELSIKQLESESERKACNTLDKENFRFSDGVKTRFLLELIQLTQSLNEKVLIFSQYIGPLDFLLEQISSFFNWSEGREILHMHGKMEQKQRQALINNFNDSNTEAMVLLASTRACSEGIHLVAASRVVLLDVLWNPSVERQAISRAYRLGQKRVVYTYHLMIQGTQEYAKYCKQAEKHRLSELVFSSTEEDGQKDETAMAPLKDRILDEMVHHQELKGIFRKIIYPKESDSLESFSSLADSSKQIHSC